MRVKRLVPDARLPERQSDGAGGYDLFAAEDVTILESQVTKTGAVIIGHGTVSTGLALEIPTGFVGRIGSRSGLSTKQNIEVGAGWIDADYRGPVKVELKNFGSDPFVVRPGDRIAQLFVLPIRLDPIEETETLTDTARGPGGFGSTGR